MLRIGFIILLTLIVSSPASAKCWNGTAWVHGACYEWKKQEAIRKHLEKQKQGEMEAEQRAYQRMQADRKSAPTTEHCYMVQGEMVCKPAP